jgi:hypothetical protein
MVYAKKTELECDKLGFNVPAPSTLLLEMLN